MPSTNKKAALQTVDIKIYRQKRRNMMMRVVPGMVEVYIPHYLREDDRRVKQFVERGMTQLRDKVPDVPPEKTSREQIMTMVADYGERLGVHPTRVQLRDMRRKWGSCSSKGTVTLNTRLTWLDPELAEYVVCHELAHLIELNHSNRFWALLARHMPDYETRLMRLRAVEKTLW